MSDIREEIFAPLLRLAKIIAVGIVIVSATMIVKEYAGKTFTAVALTITILILVASLFLMHIKHEVEDKKANSEQEIFRPWTYEQLQKRRDENDTKMKRGAIAAVCFAMLVGLL